MRPWCIVCGRSLLFAAAVCLTGSAAQAGGAVSAGQIESFLGLSSGVLDGVGDGPAINGSAIQTTFSATAGQVLSFQYQFLTNEDPTAGLNLVNDFAFVTLNSQDPTSLADVASTTFSSSSTPFALGSSILTFTMTLADAGLYTLGIGVVNVTDDTYPSGLLVDNLKLDSTLLPNGGFDGPWTGFSFMAIGNTSIVGADYGAPVPQGTHQALLSAASVPEPTSMVSLGFGALLILFKARRRSNA
ncbi:MAG: PEP-CTERM sorting domain-containing protein [Paludisphaera borealis]|uniref:PEP-CTERM sorting domain-containing protein n=1 Tax=Paludisphaera borealis TaxID=1387353 RepID=UPI00284BD338|nr:PEP-CTERM sorting domain-containing protein [Paludisphaera borealis]MDR3618006.1 PEP-CTERM sorting domain-containing protein [Paludisphaera borealis]